MNWKDLIEEETKKDYYLKLRSAIIADSKNNTIYPATVNVFNAFKLTPLDKVKVVLLAQDPYFNPGQAHGLSFSVLEECPIPPSLKNIFKEIKSDLSLDYNFVHGNLTAWAKQGVLLINNVLTVRQGEPNSHKNFGWEIFTDSVISHVNSSSNPIVYLLWGKSAQEKTKLISNPKHLVLTAAHPSPLSAHNGFFGSKPFSKTNDFLIKNELSPIDWRN